MNFTYILLKYSHYDSCIILSLIVFLLLVNGTSTQFSAFWHFFSIQTPLKKVSLANYLGLPKGLFPVGVRVKILKALLPSSILAT